MQWLTLFNAARCLLSLDKAPVGEDFKVAWGGKKKIKDCFLSKKINLHLQIIKISAAYA